MWTRIQLEFPTMYRSAVDGAPRVERTPRLIGWIRVAAMRWTQRRILEELGDRDLRDIGISRSEALAEARKPFWRR